ncbi:MAG: hypothetical protein HFJ09_05420 [Lachnospiraceae bacterium]|nr:hypothetical protein [Lachnospiraceae bacterium]
MNGYEKLISIIRQEVKRNQETYRIKRGTMTSAKTCAVGELELDEEDLIKADIELKKGDEVLIVKLSEDTWVILCKVVNV